MKDLYSYHCGAATFTEVKDLRSSSISFNELSVDN